MRFSFFSLFGCLLLSGVAVIAASMPDKIYGVNLGSWLVLEPWMLPQEWVNMGGESCEDDCSTCISTEFTFAQAYPDTVDEIFAEHWDTWFNQTDVDTLKELGINTVRIPLGYWIIEALVDCETEFYPRGGIVALIRGLQQLQEAGIVAILDHHALPGVQDANQMFTGNCTTNVQFYTPYNYGRALVWAGVMTGLSHLHPAFKSVFAIEAVNEPIMNASNTPGYGTYQQQFVTVVRAVESALGIQAHGFQANSQQTSANASHAITNMISTQTNPLFDPSVIDALTETALILAQLALDDETQFDLEAFAYGQSPLVTNFMDVNWQYNDPPNPAAAANGPQAYDNHLYYSFGGVADPTPEAYMQSICNLNRIQADKALGDSPLWFGEWGLPTQFDATDEFLVQWADAQKLAYSQGAGWIFWNFKVENSVLANNISREWSYIDGVNLGFLTKDPSQVHNASVCDGYTT